jgi:gluconolactonase
MKTKHFASRLGLLLALPTAAAVVGCSSGGGNPMTPGTAGTMGAGGTGGATGVAGSGGTGGTTGTAGTGVAGQSGAAGTSAGTGGAASGTGGVAGTSGGGAGGTGTAGTGGSGSGGRGGGSAGTGGSAGSAGSGASGRGGATGGSGGSGGAAGSGGGANRYTCPSGTFTAPNPSSITLTKVAGVPPFDSFNNNGNNFGNIEGAVWFGDAIYVSEISSDPNPPKARILRVPTTGAVTIAYATSGSNGLAVDLMGRLIGASHTAGAVQAFNLTNMTATSIVSGYMGKRLNTPNDLTVRSDGTIYFTDPDFQAPSPLPQQMTRVYRLPPGATEPIVVDATLSNPNGITLSLDEAFLFVTAGSSLYRFAVNPDGSTGTRTQIAMGTFSSGGDGMSIDCSGTLYVTAGNRLYLINPTGNGTLLGSVMVSAASATNVAFGGANHQTLYVTGQGNGTGGGSTMGLWRADLPLPGMPF